MEDLHRPRCSYLHQEQKHQGIHCKNLTHMITLENLISFKEGSHTLENEASLARG